MHAVVEELLARIYRLDSIKHDRFFEGDGLTGGFWCDVQSKKTTNWSGFASLKNGPATVSPVEGFLSETQSSDSLITRILAVGPP